MSEGGADRAWTDEQYSPLRTVPDATGWLRGYRERSDAARRHRPPRARSSGPDARECWELFHPDTDPDAGSGPVPAVVFVHGGGWDSLSLEDSAFLARPLAARGVATVVLDYGLAPEHPLEDIIAMVARGLDDVVATAPGLGVDPRRTVVAATSAGAHLVAAALARPGVGPVFAGAVLLSGIYDLEPLRRSYYAELLDLGPDRVERCSPARTGGWPLIEALLAVGGDESEEFRRQNALMCRRLEDLGAPVHAAEVPGRHHLDLPDDVADPDTAVGAAVARMLGHPAPGDPQEP